MNVATPPFAFAGEIASLGAALIWSGSMSVFTKYSAGIPASAINFFKNVVAVTCLSAAALLTLPAWGHDPWSYGILAASGVIGISLGDTALFGALKRLGAQITSASQCLTPPVAALIAMAALGESLSLLEAAGMLITTVAITCLVLASRRRGAQLAGVERATLLLGLGFALIAAVCQAAGLVLSRRALQDVDVLSGTLTRIMPSLLVLTAMLLISGDARRLDFVIKEPRRAIMLGVASFAGTFIGLILMGVGVKYSKAGIAAALTSTYPIWIIPIAHFALKERVRWPAVVCTCVAVGGIVLMFL